MKKTAATVAAAAKMAATCEGTPYRLLTREYSDWLSIFVRARDFLDEHIPAIAFEDAPYGNEDAPNFKIHIPSYDALRPSEIEQVIAGLRTAAALAETLTALATEALHAPDA